MSIAPTINRLDPTGPINPIEVRDYFKVWGKLATKKKVIQWEKHQLPFNPDYTKDITNERDTGLIEDFVKSLFKMAENYDDYLNREKTDALEIFFKFSHLLKSSYIFWRIAPIFWNIFGSYDERWIALFKKHKRNTTFSDRTHGFRRNGVSGWGDEFPHGNVRSDGAFYYEDKLWDKFNYDEWVKVYRAFHVRHGKPVRKGVRKIDNPQAHLQEEGKGISFTLSKIQGSKWLNQQHNSFYYKTYFGIEDIDEMRKICNEKGNLHPGLVAMMIKPNVYSCLGTFAVRKKDLIASNLYRGEEEVLADPADARLIRYEFINLYDALAASFIYNDLAHQMPHAEELHNRPLYLFYSIYPETKLLRDISKALKAYLDDDAKRRFISEKHNDDDMSFITQTLHGKVLPKSLGKEGLRYVA